MSRYLIDTSVWIDFFRGKSEMIKNRLLQLLNENAICFNGIILSELMIGARTRKELTFIKDNFEGLIYLEMDRDFFVYASEIGNQVQKSGKTISLSDLLIMAHARKYDLIVFTRDRHFESLGQSLNFQYEIFQNC
ncbi:MAG: PIN domain-containing protein [Candidatus Aminicenantes bacterium]|nr:PIN domain-containing protein [Candidatus Aminicenantes bacterium]